MKFIPKDDLVKMLKYSSNDDFSLEDMKEIFELFGDDWFVMDGDLQCTNENQDRKSYICMLKGNRKQKDLTKAERKDIEEFFYYLKRKIREEEFVREIR